MITALIIILAFTSYTMVGGILYRVLEENAGHGDAPPPVCGVIWPLALPWLLGNLISKKMIEFSRRPKKIKEKKPKVSLEVCANCREEMSLGPHR